MNPKCAIVILNWDNVEETIDCIESVFRSEYSNFQIIVADNGYDEHYPTILRKLFPQVQVIENKKNLGFAEGNNVGIRKALSEGADYVFVLNNDTLVRKDTISNLVKTFEDNPSIGIIGALTWEYTCPEQYQECGGYFDRKTGRVDWYWHDSRPSNSGTGFTKVDFVFGSGMCLRRKTLEEVGMFDSEYYLYFEDIELCSRAKSKGWEIVIAHNSQIWHKMGAWMTIGMIRPLSGYYFLRNYNYFVQRYGYLSARIRMHLFNFKIFTSKQFLIMLSKIGLGNENIKGHYAIRQGIIDFYLKRKYQQNTWQLEDGRISKIGGVSNSINSKQITDKPLNKRIYIPLPELLEEDLDRVKSWLIPLTQKFPNVDFLIWIYPTNVNYSDAVLKENRYQYYFREGWLKPEKWDDETCIRWISKKAGMVIQEENIEKIQFCVKPKLSRWYRILPWSPIKGIQWSITTNQTETRIIRLKNKDFQFITIPVKPNDSLVLDFEANKTYRYGFFNKHHISIAFKGITYTSKDKNNNPQKINICLDRVQYKIDFVNELQQINNIYFLTPAQLRNMKSFYSTVDMVILWTPSPDAVRRGIVLSTARNRVPVIASEEVIKHFQLKKGYDVICFDDNHFGDSVRFIIESSETRSNMISNIQKSLSEYLGVSIP